jgi:hypothetical protein
MSRRDVSLQAIQAEIHKCRDELMFLGCGDRQSEPKCADALSQIIVRLDTMASKLSEGPLLIFITSEKELLQEVMQASAKRKLTAGVFHSACSCLK